jgi:threonine synthase
MGEGHTPEVPVEIDGRTVRAKLELLSPTLSFKDRGAVWLMAAAVELGASRVVADSSGNAGTAVAAYAARAGLPCDVFVPASASPAKLAQMEAHGTTIHRVQGVRSQAALAAHEAVAELGAFYASHVWNPLFYEGTKQVVLELDPLPEVLVLPVGNGTLVLGAARVRREGMRIIGVRAGAGTVAEGIDIADPPRWSQVAAVVEHFITVTDDEITAAQRALAHQGLFVEPTAAVPAAALAQVERDVDVVIPLTGAGAKSADVSWVRGAGTPER